MEMLLLVAAYGICFGLQNKAVMLHGKFGFTDRLLSCTYCTGFHSGWVAWLLWAAAFGFTAVGFAGNLSNVLLTSFASAAFSYAVDTLVRLAETNASDFEEVEVDD